MIVAWSFCRRVSEKELEGGVGTAIIRNTVMIERLTSGSLALKPARAITYTIVYYIVCARRQLHDHKRSLRRFSWQ